jgi:hypothetical protein
VPTFPTRRKRASSPATASGIMDGYLQEPLNNQAMLYQGNKKIVFAFLFVMILFSCTKEKSSLQENKYLYFNKSISIIKTDGYYNVFNNMQDSLKLWCHVKLQAYGELWYYNYKLDSLLCFNSQKNKVIGALLIPCTKGDCLQDDIRFFYGIKIKGKWYFFDGATIVLPRENYQKDASKPLSFSKLHEIAMQEVFSGYLVRKKKDAGFWKNLFAPEYEYEVNERFFEQMENKNQDGTYLGFKTFEEAMLWQVKLNWKKK